MISSILYQLFKKHDLVIAFNNKNNGCITIMYIKIENKLAISNSELVFLYIEQKSVI